MPVNESDWPVHLQTRLVSGPDAFSALKSECSGLTVLIITSAGFTKRGVVAELKQYLAAATEVLLFDGITPNPELDLLDKLTTQFRPLKPQLLIALGGGSALDAAKVLAQTLVQPDQPDGLLNLHFRQKQPLNWLPSLPLITIPTTAGTGAEVTPFATVWDGIFHKKYSLAHQGMYPVLTILQPQLTLSLPWQETLYTALDTVSHSLETLWNKHNTPVSRNYAVQALELVMQHLESVLTQPDQLKGREQLQKASFLAGLAISINRTAIAHSISYPLTSHYAVPHGLACSFSLPAIIELVMSKQAVSKDIQPLLARLSDWLLQLPLYSELVQYLSWQKLYELVPEMVNPGRADNFVLPVHEQRITQVLQRSEQMAKEQKTTGTI
ncbi:phosphonoacetaldehyde reductase [Rheinheimera soli]|uniref:Alcohol dehydrogenase n=1 Tax=Rheinheimera soli TaxID=443616 RepID=A0ABU1VU26_9GAMM|nr:phosphonoacetaldehyde reductase [Rheinheimera soli]MDR7119210.1 alcohol dehydrogenase [Rheinheimera soli]